LVNAGNKGAALCHDTTNKRESTGCTAAAGGKLSILKRELNYGQFPKMAFRDWYIFSPSRVAICEDNAKSIPFL
jgi:hypothetical protein